MLYPTTSSNNGENLLVKQVKGEAMSAKMSAKMSSNIMTLASIVAPSFNSNYPTTATTWFTKRAYAHFGTEAIGVNG